MSLYNPEGTPPIAPSGVARIERRLPYPGEVVVRTGQRVEPETVVATAFVPAPPQIINVAEALAIPVARIPRALRREVGNKLEAGELLARVGARSCTTPVSGVISAVDANTGYVTITPDPARYELYANLRGIVMEVLPYRGVVIETPAAQVYGIVGVGSERSGVLRLMVTDPTEEVQPEQIDARSAYAVLICGATISAAALRRAVQEQVRGIIVGGIENHELRAFLGHDHTKTWYTGRGGWQLPNPRTAAEPGLTLLMTEGFGKQPMSAPIFDLLSSHDREEVLIDGTTCLRHTLRRPRVVVPLPRSSGDVNPAHYVIQPGATVRLLGAPHLGQVATVRTVSLLPQRIAAGIHAAAVEVVQADAAPFWVPRTAVEVLP
jgi:hypothetical protein